MDTILLLKLDSSISVWLFWSLRRSQHYNSVNVCDLCCL